MSCKHILKLYKNWQRHYFLLEFFVFSCTLLERSSSSSFELSTVWQIHLSPYTSAVYRLGLETGDRNVLVRRHAALKSRFLATDNHSRIQFTFHAKTKSQSVRHRFHQLFPSPFPCLPRGIIAGGVFQTRL